LVGLPAEAVDLLVLGGDPGQCFGLEGGEVGDRLISSRESWFEGGDLVFESVDLGVAPVGVVAGLVAGLESGLELLAQVGVGPVP